MRNFVKSPVSIMVLISVILLFVTISTVNSISNKVDFRTFDWNGVSGVSDVLMTLVTLVLMLSIWQAKDAHNESTKARIQSTNASDAEILRWAMDEMGKRKSHIRLVTDAYKEDLENILINNYKFKPSGEGDELKPHKYQLRKAQPKYTDQARMEFINNMDSEERERFYLDVKEIKGDNWDKKVKDALHKEASIIMQRMGYMALFGLISKQHFINLWGPMFLASWYSIEWYIKEERKKLGENLEDVKPEKVGDIIQMFGAGGNNKEYDGAFFRIHLEVFIKECEDKLPLILVNNERLKFGKELMLGTKSREKSREDCENLINSRGYQLKKTLSGEYFVLEGKDYTQGFGSRNRKNRVFESRNLSEVYQWAEKVPKLT